MARVVVARAAVARVVARVAVRLEVVRVAVATEGETEAARRAGAATAGGAMVVGLVAAKEAAGVVVVTVADSSGARAGRADGQGVKAAEGAGNRWAPRPSRTLDRHGPALEYATLC